MGKHILIIGGGIIGLSSAYYAVQRGHRVTLLERGQANHNGCSFGNAGLITPSHFVPLAAPGIVAKGIKWMLNPESPFYVKPRMNRELWDWGWKFYRAANHAHVVRSAPLLRDLSFASRSCFEDLASSLGNDFGFQERGIIMLCKTEHGMEEEAKTAEYAHQLGIPAEVLTKEQAAKIDPDVRMDIVGAVYFPKDAHLSPGHFMACMTQELLQQSVQFQWETEVTGWRVTGNRVQNVVTSRGEFNADEYVLCGGAWSPGTLRGLSISLPMQAGKGYSFTLEHPRELPHLPAIFVEARVAVTPLGNALRFGGTMEIAGIDERVNPARIRGILKSVPKYFPSFTADDFRGIQPWCGLRPCTPDGLPYVGRFSRYENLSTATGHAMLGVSLGPITGKLMAEVLSEDNPSISIEALSPDRYSRWRREERE
jgi:D-amino-acid dehydrogenase